MRTARIDLPEDVSGLTLMGPDLGFFVVANRAHAALRRRFSCAHEHQHLLVDRDARGLVSLGRDRDQVVEVRANAFAAAFLMLEEAVRHLVRTLGKGQPGPAAPGRGPRRPALRRQPTRDPLPAQEPQPPHRTHRGGAGPRHRVPGPGLARAHLVAERALNTPGILVQAIHEGHLTVETADAYKRVLVEHRFVMRFDAFRDVVDQGA